MDKIKVRDREFTVSIPEAKILQRVAEVAAQINNDLKMRILFFGGSEWFIRFCRRPDALYGNALRNFICQNGIV